MEEGAAHALYTEFKAVDAGARFKQGIGFAGQARAGPRGLQGYEETRGDDDVIARNRRLFGQGTARREEEESDYDSDSAEAVTRRLKQLKRQQRRQREEQQQTEGQPRGQGPAAAAAPLPERLYDEKVERRVQQHLREQRAAAHHGIGRRAERRRSRSRSRERRRSRSWSREQRRSRSWSKERRRPDSIGSRRRSRSRDRRRSRSRDQRRRRSRSQERGSDDRQARQQGRRDERQPGPAPGVTDAVGTAAAGLQKLDFEALIPGFAAMNAPQKLRAKTQFLLERSAARDGGRGGAPGAPQQGQWTRFKFDAHAELEEERRAPPSAGGPGAGEDEDEPEDAARLGGRNAVSFGASNAEAVQQQRDRSHEAAIFGWAASQGAGQRAAAGGVKPAAAAGEDSVPARVLPLDEAEGAVVVSAEELAAVTTAAAAAPQQTGGGAAPNWRERALAARRAKQQHQ